MSDYYLGIDLGGTNTKIGIGTMSGTLAASGSIPTFVEKGPEAWVHRIVDEVKKWNLEFKAVGIGSPGPLETATGTILSTPNLKNFQGFSMKPAFEKEFGKPCRFENDANCAALGEFYFGTRKGQDHLVVLTLGTGVGSGIISEKKLIRGAGGYASELGHMIINFDGLPCKCGKRGCFEAYVGARNTLLRYKELSKSNDPNLTIKDIFDLALQKPNEPASRHAVEIFNEWTYALAVGLDNTLTIFNPSAIILTGGVTEAWAEIKPKLVSLLAAMSEDYLLKPALIEISKLGQYFGVHGAIALAAENIKN